MIRGSGTGVEPLLQLDVEGSCSQAAAVHGGEHLDIVDGIEAEPLWYPLGHHLHQLVVDVLGGVRADEVEIALGLSRSLRHLALVDAVGVDDDLGGGRLAEDLGEPHGGHRTGTDHVRQHGTGADGRQLVHVAHQQHRAVIRHRPQQLVHQHRIDHRYLVHHDQLAIEGLVLVAL